MLPEVKVETNAYTLTGLRDLSAKELSERLRSGQIDITVEGALCEWGSPLEDVFRKLESSVMQWREDGVTKTIVIQFVEPDTDCSEDAAASGDIIRLDSH